jgi:aromatic ring-opening dioxygenase catalytic subunit (LigB family)
MKLIDPDATIPIVQISVLRSQDASELLRMGMAQFCKPTSERFAENNMRITGAALAPLRDENVALLGSGSPSYHDVVKWMSGILVGDKEFAERQTEWHEALERALKQCEADRSVGELERWREFPHSYEMHPRGAAEHFSTLLLCAGAAGGAPVHLSKFDVMGAMEASFWWD